MAEAHSRPAALMVTSLSVKSGTRQEREVRSFKVSFTWNFGFFCDGDTMHVTEMRHSLGAIGAI
jgi:hypothetical protein